MASCSLRGGERSPPRESTAPASAPSSTPDWWRRSVRCKARSWPPPATCARTDAVCRRGASRRTAFDFAFLLEGRDRYRFDQEVGRLKQAMRNRVDIGYIGPLPPYSFAETDLSHEAAAWA